ncbi:MAG: Glutamate-tRNA ligase [Candidatus Wolfebacteria bacterium GW2011_GWA2_47_9b]|uniref:Glutamate--tRNA ligase n=1 Tax=Candidatus Wolfebacteria bacterium GW2011_GWA2_47_9b TaxID=1619005 RepID=A0A0G1U411_9BACT|nr:MAG: Glutamate-tRNA ligase [Candidatus Wolfebacteria bacterium GW2011_GWA2_47_9b]
MPDSKKVRVRFAPSPTGPLHIGSARTALFNWLFARGNGGVFILRIEDTDKERSKGEFEEDILFGLKWLGLGHDEFSRQSERGDIYKKYLEQLLQEEKAYYCFCSKEKLQAEKEGMLAEGRAPRYSGTCRTLSKQEAQKKKDAGEGCVIRLKMPETKISFKDIIRGEITFEGALMGDSVIARDLDTPLYNFVVVIDDIWSEITHVIRGEDHISNTPRQIVLMDALGFEKPKFAHLPMILNLDRSKMSKRFADTALREYIQKGYVKEALINFIGLLGWHPEGDREILSIENLVSEFSLEKVQKSGAVFNQEKLDWLSNLYTKQMDNKVFAKIAKDFIPENWELNEAMMNSVKERINRFGELEDLVRFYFELPQYEAALLVWKEMSKGQVKESLEKARGIVEAIPDTDFKTDLLEKTILEAISGESRGEILWPLRVALSGQKNSPSPFEIMAALGKEESLARIDRALTK